MFFRRLNWNIVGWFRTVSYISYLVIGAGLATMLYHSFTAPGGGFQPSHALQLGLSFTGGTDIDVRFKQPVGEDRVKAAFAGLNAVDLHISTVGGPGNPPNMRYSVQTQTAFGDKTPQLWSALNTVGPVDRAASSISSVGPSLGREYLTNALWALVIALGIQFIYIAFRFGWNYIFGLVTVIALVRDAAMMIGIYAIAGKRADDAFLAAVLTVIGYSVMDTIVILDRIRENTKLMVDSTYDEIVNTSIKQTMTRSLNTLATVVITLVALLALGGASLQNFAFALLVGIVSGGYHSIFYSAPLVLVFRKRQFEAAARRRRAGLAQSQARTPRTVAEAKALGARGGMAREDIVAARRERRAKNKSVRPAGTGPARYRKKREDGATATAIDQADVVEDTELEEYDPLDAQNAGLHDEALRQGHEEIELNLEGFELQSEPPEHDDAHKEES
ncbi:MAG: protein translocase subunit SecF [Candidatus Eremiobacteraeota bacterium]|nr:protein translocase subunit SecF [Candidatus Eremiobacteraeota bacterium]